MLDSTKIRSSMELKGHPARKAKAAMCDHIYKILGNDKEHYFDGYIGSRWYGTISGTKCSIQNSRTGALTTSRLIAIPTTDLLEIYKEILLSYEKYS